MTSPRTFRPHLVVNGVLLGILLCGLGMLASLEVTFAGRVHASVLGRDLPDSCVYLMRTGKPCPGCGITRSLVTALHGDWARSRQFHAAGIPLLLLACGQVVLRIAFCWRRLRHPAVDIAVSSATLICVGVLLNG